MMANKEDYIANVNELSSIFIEKREFNIFEIYIYIYTKVKQDIKTSK